MDIIYLRELTINTIIGVCSFEKQIKQTLLLDIEVGVDIKTAANSSSLKDTIDYESLAKVLTEFISSQQFHLIETIAEKSTTFLLQKYPRIHTIKLSVTKPGAVSNAKSVGITIVRGQTNS